MRMEPDGRLPKKLIQIWYMKGVSRVLYRLPEVLAAKEVGRTVHIAEGDPGQGL